MTDSNNKPDLLKEYPVVVAHTVDWSEMDAFKHVNNAVYFRYFENARIAYFMQINAFELFDQENIWPVLAETQCRFKIPLIFPDELLIGARIGEQQHDALIMQYAVYSKKANKIAAEGEALVKWVDKTSGKKTVFPAALHKILLK
ncbi:MAG: acyl-CoA thioesterase [Gammaproteobacteria bacterium]|nr:acyl-CoA thioesterase [Gammaproteobacteria bacterium]